MIQNQAGYLLLFCQTVVILSNYHLFVKLVFLFNRYYSYVQICYLFVKLLLFQQADIQTVIFLANCYLFVKLFIFLLLQSHDLKMRKYASFLCDTQTRQLTPETQSHHFVLMFSMMRAQPIEQSNMPRRFGKQQRTEVGRLLDERIIQVTEDPRVLDRINHEHFGEYMDLTNANSVANARRRLCNLMTQYSTTETHRIRRMPGKFNDLRFS